MNRIYNNIGEINQKVSANFELSQVKFAIDIFQNQTFMKTVLCYENHTYLQRHIEQKLKLPENP